MARFDGKRVLVTGGTSGIGLATALRIVEEGGDVIVTGTSQEHLDEAGRRLPKSAPVLRNDASDPAAAEELAEKVAEAGGIDGAFLNAGYGKFWPVEATDAETFDHMMNVNVRGPALQMAALKGEIRDGGAVLLTSSVAPYLGQGDAAVYGATKASCYAMARAWARDLAPRRIRVNAVGPGPIDTRFLSSMENVSAEQQKEFEAGVTDAVPLGRMGTSEEVAAVCCFLLSDEASYVTGSEYMVDGGMTMR